jgi:hypothetical protein
MFIREGYFSAANTYKLHSRGVAVLADSRRNMHQLASRFQWACLRARNRIEEPLEFFKYFFGFICPTQRSSSILLIPLRVCFLAHSLDNKLLA